MARFDVAIIGGGPGGYIAAIRAAQLDLRPVLIERDRVGGLCLNWGCIPSKALISSAELIQLFRESERFGITCGSVNFDLATAVNRSRGVVERLVKGVEYLLKKNGVATLRGSASLLSPTEITLEPSGELVEADHIVLATGGRACSLPSLPADGARVLTSRDALQLKTLPSSLTIVGGGSIGVEFAYLFAAYGVPVTIVELLDRLLPMEDQEISLELQRAFSRLGISYLLATRVARAEKTNDGMRLYLEGEDGEGSLDSEVVLVAVGMQGNMHALGLESAGIRVQKDFVEIDEHMRTSVPGVYAIGDVTGKLMLAHAAAAQGVHAVEHIAGRQTAPIDYGKMPRCTYCQPQVASLGMTEAEARSRGLEVTIGRFPFRANGKAMAIGNTTGLVKLIAEAQTGRILGYHIIGHNATEVLVAASLATQMELSATQLAAAVYAHPTLSEALKEAAQAVQGEAIHV